jgi:hypothetical protein
MKTSLIQTEKLRQQNSGKLQVMRNSSMFLNREEIRNCLQNPIRKKTLSTQKPELAQRLLSTLLMDLARRYNMQLLMLVGHRLQRV